MCLQSKIYTEYVELKQSPAAENKFAEESTRI